MRHGLYILIQVDVGKFSVSISYEDMHETLLELWYGILRIVKLNSTLVIK